MANMIRHRGEIYVEAGNPFHRLHPRLHKSKGTNPFHGLHPSLHHKKCPEGSVWSRDQKKCVKLTPEQLAARKKYLKQHPRKKK